MGSPRLLAVMPRVLGGALHGLRHRRVPPKAPAGGTLGLPADILVDSQGSVTAVKYGEHAYDQWSVEELLTLVAADQSAPRSRATNVG